MEKVEFKGLPQIFARKLGTFNGNHLGAEVMDGMSYSFVITNSGTMTLNNLEIEDNMLITSQISIECNMQGDSLDPGETVDCFASAAYEITPEDIQRSILSNSATVSAIDPVEESRISTVITHEQGLASNPVIYHTLEMTWIDERIVGLTEINEEIELIYTIQVCYCPLFLFVLTTAERHFKIFIQTLPQKLVANSIVVVSYVRLRV